MLLLKFTDAFLPSDLCPINRWEERRRQASSQHLREMSTERCAHVIAVGMVNKFNEIIMATQEIIVYFFLALNLPWLIRR